MKSNGSWTRTWTWTRIWILLGIGATSAWGQADSTQWDWGDFGGIITLDSVTVQASRRGFDVADFVQFVQEDQSFYRAFRNLRFQTYRAENAIAMYDKRNHKKATYRNVIRQLSEGRCRTMEVLEESVTGNFYKRKKRYRYYTATLFDRLFFTWEKVCEEQQEELETDAKAKGMEKHIRELKKLIFQPGTKADVPLIGNKTEIFSPKMRPYYDFSIQRKSHQNGRDCYVFTATVKEAYQTHKQDKTVIKFLETYFDKDSFQVLARNYRLAYRGSLFDFDVKMEIELEQRGDTYLPRLIRYDGFWDVPGKKPEISRFKARFDHSAQ